MVGQEPDNVFLEFLRFIVAMKRNYVRLLDLNFLYGIQFLRRGPPSFPNTAGQWLARMRVPRPIKYFWQKPHNQGNFIFRLQLFVAALVSIVRFIPNVPTKNTLVCREGTNNAFHVRLKA